MKLGPANEEEQREGRCCDMRPGREGRGIVSKREREGESTTPKMLVLLEMRFSASKPTKLGLVKELHCFASDSNLPAVKY